ncbi:DUF2513 domain-containing protein [bacterium]|nr:MAG: DUF2513 domain-containing protein [bacterium]
MKRDFDLIRRLMKDIESVPAGKKYKDIGYLLPDYDADTVYKHISLLLDANLIKGRTVNLMRGISGVVIDGLTWSGHDFLDAAKDDTLWNKAKETVLTPAVAITFELLCDWLKQQAKEKLGLP